MGLSGREIHGTVCRTGTGPESFVSKGELRMPASRQSLADRELRRSKVYEQAQDLAAEISFGPPRLQYDVPEARSGFLCGCALARRD